MNLFQRASLSGAFLIFTGLLGGLGLSIQSSNISEPLHFIQDNFDVILVALIIILMRIKFLLDNHKYFADPQQDQLVSRLLSFLLACICWVLYAISAGLIKNSGVSLEVMGYGIVVSTAWLLLNAYELHTLKNNNYTIRGVKLTESQIHKFCPHWLAFNLIYILIIFLYNDYGILIGIPNFCYEHYILLAIFLLTILVDYRISRTFINILG
jgi:hypothetical protein